MQRLLIIEPFVSGRRSTQKQAPVARTLLLSFVLFVIVQKSLGRARGCSETAFPNNALLDRV